MKRIRIRIDANNTVKLLEGKRVGIKVPVGAEAIEIELTKLPKETSSDSISKIFDVFFNGRPA